MALDAPAVDSTFVGGPTVMFGSPVFAPPLPMDPSTQAEGRYTLLAVVDGAPAVEFTSVMVSGYTADQLGLGSLDHNISVSGCDPAWSLLGAPTVDGRPEWWRVLDSIEWWLIEDGSLVASGFSEGAVELGPMVDLAVRGGGALLRDRYLGDGGIEDILGGVGSFPTASLAGWTVDSGVSTQWNTTDPFDGDRCLRVKGFGWVRSPWGGTVHGATTASIQVFSTFMARFSAEPDAMQGLLLHTEVRRVSDGEIVLAGWATAQETTTDPGLTDWQVVEAPGRLPREEGLFQARTSILVIDDDWIDIDRVRQVTKGMTGSLSPVSLETLFQRVLNRAQQPQCGGDLGITVAVESPSGVSDVMRWEHADDPAVSDALSSIVDRSDGPDAWWTPDRTIHLAARAGTGRTDLVLNRDTVISARVTPDPSSRWLETRVKYGSGSGVSRIVAGWTETDGSVIRRRSYQLAPEELSYRSTESWGAGVAEVLARRHLAVEAVVPAWYGRLFRRGDRVPVVLAVECGAVSDTLRVVRRTVDPVADTCTVTVAPDRESVS